MHVMKPIASEEIPRGDDWVYETNMTDTAAS